MRLVLAPAALATVALALALTTRSAPATGVWSGGPPDAPGASVAFAARDGRAPSPHGVAQGDTSPAGVLIGEGGHAAAAPENTLAALTAALADEMPSVWLHVRSTSDGALVLMRDATLDRTTDCTGEVRARTAAEIGACDAGAWFDPRFAGEGVPTLTAALQVPGAAFVLELADADASAVLAQVDSTGTGDRVELASGDDASLAQVEAARPGARTWLVGGTLDDRLVSRAQAAGVDGVAAPADTITSAAVGLAHRSGLAVIAYGADRAATMYELFASAVDRVVAPNPADLAWSLGATYRTYGGSDVGRTDEPGSNFPAALAAGDFDNDGRADLALGAPSDSAGGRDAGWAGVVYGAARFGERVYPDVGDEPGGQWGAVFAVGDWNLDRFQDLAIGVPRRDFSGQDSGTVWLWDGSPTGVGQLSRPIRDIGVEGALDGSSVAVADFNSDGVDDMAVGSPGITLLGQTGAGQVTLMRSREMAGPISDGRLVVDRRSDEVPGLVSDGDRLGSSLAAGDFDGDGYDDLAVSIPGADTPDLRDVGGVLLIHCMVDAETEAITATRYVLITRDDPRIPGDAERNGEFGAALAAEDFDDDGMADLVVSIPAATVGGKRGAGELAVLYGHEDGPGAGRVQMISADSGWIPGEAEPSDGFGRVLEVGDINGDRRPDLIVGMPEKNVRTFLDAGQVVAILGADGGLDPRRSLEVQAGMYPIGAAAQNRQELGRSVAVADLNGDSIPDLAIGAVGQSIGSASQAGALVVAYGPSDDLVGVPTATVRPPTPTATTTVSPTPRPTRTALPLLHTYVPYAARLHVLGSRYPEPTLPPPGRTPPPPLPDTHPR